MVTRWGLMSRFQVRNNTVLRSRKTGALYQPLTIIFSDDGDSHGDVASDGDGNVDDNKDAQPLHDDDQNETLSLFSRLQHLD